MNLQMTPIGYCIFIAISLLSFTSCVNRRVSHYMPNEAYMMGLANKGSLKVAGSYLKNEPRSSSRKIAQANIQVAYSPIKHLGLVGSFYQAKGQRIRTPAFTKNTNFELGVGYYHKGLIKPGLERSYILHDFYAGTGRGYSSALLESAATLSTTHQRFFIHYGFHIWLRRIFGISGGLRYVYLNYNKIAQEGKLSDYSNFIYYSHSFSPDLNSELNRREIDNDLRFPEISLQIQAGIKSAKLFYSITGIIPLGNIKYSYLAEAPLMNFGIVFDVDKIWKKRGAKNKLP